MVVHLYRIATGLIDSALITYAPLHFKVVSLTPTVMLTRRDKLLNRPWQLRRYNNHRKKVLTALPAIDFGPPAERHHVTCKLKKLQREGERRHKIEQDNFKLLQRMGDIMRKNRLENHWETPLPSFLHRVGIYHRTRSPTPFQELTESRQATPERFKRNKGCSACTPKPVPPADIPEVRVPWTPPRSRLSRQRSSSLIAKPHSDFDIKPSMRCPMIEVAPSVNQSLPSVALGRRSRSVSSTHRVKANDSSAIAEEKCLIIKQGLLRLSFSFPSSAELKILTGGDTDESSGAAECQCKAKECPEQSTIPIITRNLVGS